MKFLQNHPQGNQLLVRKGREKSLWKSGATYLVALHHQSGKKPAWLQWHLPGLLALLESLGAPWRTMAGASQMPSFSSPALVHVADIADILI